MTRAITRTSSCRLPNKCSKGKWSLHKHFLTVTNSILCSLFTPVYLNVILQDTQKLARPLDRKTAVLSLTKTVADSEAFATKYSQKGWGFTVNALLKLLELPPDVTHKDDVNAEVDIDQMSFGVGFTPLNTIRKSPTDPWPQTGADLKVWVGSYLKEADKKHNGRVSQMAQTRLDDQAKAVLGSYIAWTWISRFNLLDLFRPIRSKIKIIMHAWWGWGYVSHMLEASYAITKV